MQRGISTHLFIEEKLTLDRLAAARDQGFQRLEILALKRHFDYQDQKCTSEVAAWLQDQEALLHSLHLPYCTQHRSGRIANWLSIAATEPHRRIKAVDEARWALEFAEKVPCPLAVVHMGAPDDEDRPRHLDAIYQSLETLVPFAADRGVRLTLENIPNRLRLDRMSQFLREARLDNVGICFDAGHANLESEPAGQILAAGEWIVTTHFHDNHGSKDEHLPPFSGDISWPKIMRSLVEINYQGCLMLEFAAHGEEIDKALESAWQISERLERCLVEAGTRGGEE